MAEFKILDFKGEYLVVPEGKSWTIIDLITQDPNSSGGVSVYSTSEEFLWNLGVSPKGYVGKDIPSLLTLRPSSGTEGVMVYEYSEGEKYFTKYFDFKGGDDFLQVPQDKQVVPTYLLTQNNQYHGTLYVHDNPDQNALWSILIFYGYEYKQARSFATPGSYVKAESAVNAMVYRETDLFSFYAETSFEIP